MRNRLKWGRSAGRRTNAGRAAGRAFAALLPGGGSLEPVVLDAALRDLEAPWPRAPRETEA